MKKIIIALIVVVVVGGSGWYYYDLNHNIVHIDPAKIGDYTLQQKEVKDVIGDTPILNHQTSPVQTMSHQQYDELMKILPNCLDGVIVGDSYRTATYFTADKTVSVMWLIKENKITCVDSRNK
jgi:hypothetical protein